MVMTRSQVAKEAEEEEEEAPPSPYSSCSTNSDPSLVLSPIHHHRHHAKEQEPAQELPLPARPYRRCAGCAQKKPADVWCCECRRCLCSDCDERRHATDALDSLRRPLCSHRVELIVDGGGVPLLSSLLEIAVIAGAVATLRPLLSAAGTMLNVDYFFESVCPVVKQVRLVVFRVDHALYPLLRGTLGAWCDTEDAFIKVFVDVWVRGVLTHTDSFALLFMKVPMTLGALIIVLALAPLLAIPYAAVATVIRMIELVLVPNCGFTLGLARITRWVNVLLWMPLKAAGWFARSTALGLIMDNEYQQHFHRRLKIPPKTGHRIRPTPSDGIEDISLGGAVNRVTRVFVYFHRKARRTIVGTILTAVFVAVIVRVVLLSLPRCGQGVLSVASVHTLLDMMDGKVNNNRTAAPQCVSVHALIRRYAKRIGIDTPDFSALGEEAQVLAKLQDSTEDDYIDQVLRLIVGASYNHFMSYPWFVRIVICMIFFAFCSAGVLRRVLHWVDLRRRYRYSAAMSKTDEEKKKGDEEKGGPGDGPSDKNVTPLPPLHDHDEVVEKPDRVPRLKQKTQRSP